MSIVLAIDPGTNESAYLYWTGRSLLNFEIVPNETLLATLRQVAWNPSHVACAIENLVNYGSKVGDEIYKTCLWSGRFYEAWHSQMGVEPELINRRDVIAKYGQPGTKRSPGPLYGMRSHLWSALAIATYITETRREAMSATPREITAP